MSVLIPAADERPDFIDLDPCRFYVAIGYVLVVRTGFADFRKQPQNGSLGNARHAGSAANGATLDQRRDDRDSLFHAQPVHEYSILTRLSIVRRERRLDGLLTLLFSLRPSRFGRLRGDLASTFVGERFESTLAAFRAAFLAHRGHDLRNQTHAEGGLLMDDQRTANRFFDHTPRVLNGIKFSSAFTPLHNYKRGMKAEIRQLRGFSN
jgi:hypothetical protein